MSLLASPAANDWVVFASAVACAGLAAGFIGGLLGGGGGMIVIPVLYYVFKALGVESGVRMHLVIGTSLAAIVPLSVMGARSHWLQGNVDFRLLKPLMPAALIGSLAAGVLGRSLNAQVLAWMFAGVASFTATNMLIKGRFASKMSSEAGKEPPPPPVLTALGAAIGCVSTLVGVGGATLTVPVLHVLGTSMRRAIGTSATLGMAIALPGALSFAVAGAHAENLPPGSFGYVHVGAAMLLFALGTVGVSAGSKLTKKVDERILRSVFALFLVASAIRMVASAS